MMDVPEHHVTIAPMTLDNIQAVEAIEQECFSAPWSHDSLVEELSNPMAVLRAALVDGQVAGYAGMHHILDEGYITNIAVTAPFRRQGIAQALVQSLLDYGKDQDLAMMTLEVRASNQAAIQLYRRFDFEEEGRRKNYYTLPTEDALIMTRKL